MNVETFMITSNDGRRMVHDARTKLVKKIYTNPKVVTKLEDLTKAKIVRVFSDIISKKIFFCRVEVKSQNIMGGLRIGELDMNRGNL